MIFYFHGFSSSAKSHKASIIRKYFSQYEIFIPDYPSHQPRTSIEYLTEYIKQNTKGVNTKSIMLMGSSLGGYYAQFLATQHSLVSAVVLINPCLEPQLTLVSQIGEQINTVTSEPFLFTQEEFNEFSRYDVATAKIFRPTLVLMDEGDEIIDCRVASNRYENRGRVILYPGGDHWFRHMGEALPEIESFYKLHVEN